MADNVRGGEGKEAEVPYESPYKDFFDKYRLLFPLWDATEDRNLSMGDAPTPPALMAELHSKISAAGAKADRFNHDAWDALFRYCGKNRAPDMRDEADRFVAVAFLRHHFIIDDHRTEELVYENGDAQCIPQATNKVKSFVPQAQVSATV